MAFAVHDMNVRSPKGASPQAHLRSDAVVLRGEAVPVVAHGAGPQFAGIVHKGQRIQDCATASAWHRLILYNLYRNVFHSHMQVTGCPWLLISLSV